MQGFRFVAGVADTVIKAGYSMTVSEHLFARTESIVHVHDLASRKDQGFIDLEDQLCTHTLT